MITYRQQQMEVAAIGSPLGVNSISAAGPASTEDSSYIKCKILKAG